jgi:ADP-heptose:LPS heptosyltransferase
MNADRMRRLDYWVGVPICFILTLLVRFRALVGIRHSPASPPRHVLLIELAEMGTTVLACPAIQRLRARHPQCRVSFLLFRQIEESVRILNVIPPEHVFTIDASSLWTLVRDTLRFRREARRLGVDIAINLEVFARFSTILTVLSGASTRVGFHRFAQEGLYTGDLLTHRVIYNPHLHTWQSLATLVEALDAPRGELPLGKFPVETACTLPQLATDDLARRRIQERVTSRQPAAAGKRWILVNPNASSLIAVRRWPLDRYAALVERLLRDPRHVCVVTGTASERDAARFIVERVQNERVVDLTGETTLRDLIDLFNVSSLLITNDSGPAHFAALTDIPVLVLFGPETPRLYGPLSRRCTTLYADYACSPCVSAYNQRRTVCTNNRCLQHFDVDTVHAEAVRLLES